MWPFSGGMPSVWLALYLVTLAVHLALIGFVVAGTGHALVHAVRGTDDRVAERTRDLLPFLLGLGITAGVAPLLFLQLLYQRPFYTANLLLGPRWGAVVPALIAGFYALYLAKAAGRRARRLALGVALACFGFVAWSWSELHLLLQDEPAWAAMYAAGDRLYANASVVPRVVLWLGVMITAYATIAVWGARRVDRRRLAGLALAGRLLGAAAVGLLVADGVSVHPAAHGWAIVLAGLLAAELAGWLATWRRPDGRGPHLATAAGALGLVATMVVREAPRLAILEPPRALAAEASGFPVFVLTAVLGVLVITQIVRTIRAVERDVN